MARKGKAGGKRIPANPAPVSGPGALSRRTDGGPGGQPVRNYPSTRYGEGVALEAQQQAAPMQSGPQGQPSGPPVQPPPDLFRPTEQPDVNPQMEALRRQADTRPPVIPPDPDMLLRYMQSIAPHPDIERLLDRYR